MLIVADNLTIVRGEVARAVEKMDAGPIQAIVRRCVQAGAQAIDINPGPLTRAPAERMAFLVRAVREATSLPLILDTANPVALRAGLAACAGRAVINGFSLEPGKREGILPLAREFDADIIGYVLDEESRVPIAEEEMLSLVVALFDAFLKTGLPPGRLIVDPVVLPLSWPDGPLHNRNVLSLIRRLPDLLGTPLRTIAGLSNLTSGALPLARKIELERAYLPMLAAVGLDMVLVNVAHAATLATARLCRALLADAVFAWNDAPPEGE